MAKGKKRVLLAPLDWGLGHATRCIPIVYDLIQQDVEVIIAVEGKTKVLLEKAFPGYSFVFLRGYNITYSKARLWLPLKIVMQLPKIVWRIYAENKWLKKIIKAYKIDAVISDNRPGLYHTTIPCIYITHQLKIKTGNSFTEWLAQKIHYHFINKYTACWVPDNEAVENNFAGDLSHPKKLPATPVKYIGTLSRFEKSIQEKKYDLLFLISGPEPQRTIFENLALAQLKKFNGTALLVKGLPGTANNEEVMDRADNNKIKIVNHLGADELSKAIQQSDIVISRSGYTTIMDLIKLRQKAILIATPGQTEQEYLAAYLMEKKIFLSISQDNFLLSNVLKAAGTFPFTNKEVDQNQYKETVKKFIQQL
jgi:uncharacterized protein (TIGR00661 family)